jgi:hypothetical protein
MSIQPFFKPENKNDETMNIYTKSITVDSFNADNFNPTNITTTNIHSDLIDSDVGTIDVLESKIINADLIDADVGTIDVLESNIIISKDYKHKDINHTLYTNFNISYNTSNNLFYVFQPNLTGPWWSFQDTNNPTILRVDNSEIVTGSKFLLKMGLQINDLNQASGNIVDFMMRIGDTGTTGKIFSSNHPMNLLPIHICIESELTCVSKTNSAPFEFGFVIVSKYTETMNNQLDSRSLVRSSNFTGLGYDNTQKSFIEYRYNINGTNANTLYNRGVYSLYKIN